MKIALVIGTRPEAIKLAPVARQLIEAGGEAPTIIGTGQQKEMLPQTLDEFGLGVDVDLSVMQDDQTLAELTARLATRLDRAIGDLAPDWTIVQGDTTSAMVGALCSFYRRMRVAHVEAGMRTNNRYSPFPEEVNRRIITQCATVTFKLLPPLRSIISWTVPLP